MTADLGTRQAMLVAALVAGARIPDGFDPRLLDAARSALLRKRAAGVAGAWPLLAGGLGCRWPGDFFAWAAGRPPAGAVRDGWDFARTLAAAGTLPPAGRLALAAREVAWRYDGTATPRKRHAPAVRRAGRAIVTQVAGRVFVSGGD